MDINEVEPNWEILEMLAIAPDSALDKSMCMMIKDILEKRGEITNEEISIKLLHILDLSAYSALASDFMMQVLNVEFTHLGGTRDMDIEKTPWRNEPPFKRN